MSVYQNLSAILPKAIPDSYNYVDLALFWLATKGSFPLVGWYHIESDWR